MKNLNIAIEASGSVNRKGFSLNLWISETWNNSSLGGGDFGLNKQLN